MHSFSHMEKKVKTLKESSKDTMHFCKEFFFFLKKKSQQHIDYIPSTWLYFPSFSNIP